jgi:hypothetical protein
MIKASEPEIRELLHQRARQFWMAQQLPPAILRRARRKRSRTVMLAGAAVLAIGALGTLALRPAPASNPGDHAAVGAASRSMPTRALKSVSYVLADPTTGGETHAHTSDGPTVTVKELREHARCMRAQGFDVPDPTRTSEGWAVIVDPGAVDLGSPQLREAMFVTCGPLGGPLTGDLVLGGLSQPQIDRFLACMRGRGFDLPRPRKQPGGDYLFDLRRTGIDTSRPAWNRALFVTCSPRLR